MRFIYKSLFLFLVLLIFSQIVYAGNMSCMYDPTPYIREKIPFVWEERDKIRWLCNITGIDSMLLDPQQKNVIRFEENIFDCGTHVIFNDEIIQTNPKRSYVKNYGVVDTFKSHINKNDTQLVNVYFTNEGLRDNREVTFEVHCTSDNNDYHFRRNVTPQYKDPYDIIDVAAYSKDNISYIIGIFFFILFVIVVGGYIWKISRP